MLSPPLGAILAIHGCGKRFRRSGTTALPFKFTARETLALPGKAALIFDGCCVVIDDVQQLVFVERFGDVVCGAYLAAAFHIKLGI